MNKLFDIERGHVVMNPTVLWIPEFKKVWERDKTTGKSLASKEISYIVFKHGFNSPYDAYAEKDKDKKILNDYFKDLKNWKPDKLVKAAEEKYKELQDSIALRLLRTSKKALEKIEMYMEEADPDQIDKIVKNTKELGNLVQSLNKLEEQVRKEQHESSSARGGMGIGLFEI